MSRKATLSPSVQYLTVADAAEKLSVHPSTVRRWIDRGNLPAFRLGEKRIGVREADLARVVSPRRSRHERGPGIDRAERFVGSTLTVVQRERGLRALAELERLSDEIASEAEAPLLQSWELINQARDQRTSDLVNATGQ